MNDLIIILSFILSIIVLVTFFKISARLAAIKDILTDERKNQAKAMYYVHYLNGNKEAARDSLLLYLLTDITKGDTSQAVRKAEFEAARKKYSSLFEDIGYQFPTDPF